MSSTFGKAIKVTLFGESHGECVGACVEGLAPGLKVDMDYMKAELYKRSARGSISTQRREADEPQIVSGAINGFTEGTPLTVLIKNNSADRGAYAVMDHIARPSHADFTAQAKYLGFQDAAGGGHFSGRLTAPLVAACSVIRYALEEKGIFIGTHISRLHDISDRAFAKDPAADIKALSAEYFPVLRLFLQKVAAVLRKQGLHHFQKGNAGRPAEFEHAGGDHFGFAVFKVYEGASGHAHPVCHFNLRKMHFLPHFLEIRIFCHGAKILVSDKSIFQIDVLKYSDTRQMYIVTTQNTPANINFQFLPTPLTY